MSEQIETPSFKNMSIGQLRQYASHMRIAIAKTSTKQEIIEAIERKLSGRVMPEIAAKDGKLKPGYARITVLSDPMPGASNMPVYVNANGYICMIPRDVEVIVPMRVVRVLNDAKVKRKQQTLIPDAHGRERFAEVEKVVPSYPFQIHEQNPGPEVLTNLELMKQKTIGPKLQYKRMFGRYPRPKELTRAIEQKLIVLTPDDQLDATTESLLGTEPEL